MNAYIACAIALLCCVTLGARAAASESAADVVATILQHVQTRVTNASATAAAAAPAPAFDTETIRAAVMQRVQEEVQKFVRAYNAHDAAAVAAQWSPYGTYTHVDGTVYKGRDAIQQLYQGIFDEYPEATVAIEVEDVQLVNAFTAIERGTTAATLKPGDEPISERYIATHVRKSNEWLMVSVADLPDETTERFAILQDLAWLVGTWQTRSGALNTEMTIARVGDGPFFQRTWMTRVGTNVVVQGVQLIGWDPSLRQVASWTFDSRGNTDKGLWTPEEKGWSIQAEGNLVDGTPFSAMYLMTQSGDNGVTIKSMNRFAGDVALPDVADVTLTRVTQ
jgi:uncharacterized protein (TIGR02246 family)